MDDKSAIEIGNLQDKLRRINKEIDYCVTKLMLLKLENKKKYVASAYYSNKMKEAEEERLKTLEDMYYWFNKDK